MTIEKPAADTEEYEEELRSALVCEDNAEFKSAISSALEGLKYSIEFASGPEDTFEKLKFNQYNLIVLNERFGVGTPQNNAVYAFLQTMPMSTRRHLFLALIGKDFKTADNMTAFVKSANIVVNEKDVPNLNAVLKKSVADNDQFYKVFKESLVKMGKR
jgi:CheY-like chemotaxis protein